MSEMDGLEDAVWNDSEGSHAELPKFVHKRYSQHLHSK
jgi:hypothetical protein